ncbi:MAG: NAD(+) synthase [Candidatus Latescibacteria bacterium]|nr:NAD(+) synthase [Candidatus Latescibacterota bacterium]
MSNDWLPRIALVQMEVFPGLPDRNVAQMCTHIDAAREAGAQVVVFSELCISGYILGDMWEVDALVEDFVLYSEDLRQASQGLTVVFGNVAVDSTAIGEDGRLLKYNAVYVCADGQYVQRKEVPAGLPNGVHPKTLHPNYRFFDDDRHFYSLRKLAQAKGRSFFDWIHPFETRLDDGRSFRFGVQLCEDIWSQDYQIEGDTADTLKVFRQRGAQAVFNLSSSPWTWQKNDKRNRVIRDILASSPLPLFYVNQVGAQNNGKNIIVFDGDTTAYGSDGQVVLRAQPWQPQLVLAGDVDKREVAPVPDETAAVYQGVLTGLRHLDHWRGGPNKLLVAVSGGIDSSVVVCLLAQAFGPERVFAVNMPTRFNASITQDNARVLCERLGVDYLSCPIEDLYQQVAARIKGTEFASGPGDYTRLVDENIQARIRFADILSGLAAKYGLIFTNNGNKTEVALGYATLYGDVSGAVAPIADLYKVQVIELARYLNEQIYGCEMVPDNLISGEIVPSAELSAAQDVTKGLGDPIKYGYHDAVLRQMIEYRRHPLDFLQWAIEGRLLAGLGWSEPERFRAYFPSAADWVDDLEWIERQVRINYYKRIQAPPIIVLSKRAFGFDLRETQWPGYMPRRYAGLRERVLGMEWAGGQGGGSG